METQVTPQTPVRAGRDHSWQSGCAACVFVLMLLGFGGIFEWIGWKAISSGHYEMTWRTRSSFGSDQGVQVYNGANAVRAGAGLMAFGLMLITWGLVAASDYRRDRKGLKASTHRTATWLSLTCLLGACACLVPPWHLRNWPFWTVILLVIDFAFTASEAVRDRWSKWLFGGLILTSIVVGGMDAKVGKRIVLGFFASLAIAGHILVLVPSLKKAARR